MFDWDEESGEGSKRKRRRRRAPVLLLVLFLLLATIAVSAFTYYRWCQGSSDGPQLAVTLTVPKGASGGEVVSMLHGQSVIRCGLVSRLVLVAGSARRPKGRPRRRIHRVFRKCA